MAIQLTIKDVLEKAIGKEIESQRLYNDLSRRMRDDAVRDAFLKLARQEHGHQLLLEQYLRGNIKEGVLDKGQVVDYKIAEHLEQPEIFPTTKLQDVFLIAANREKASHELYLGLAQMHPDGKAKSLLKELASQELGHKKRVEFLYTEVAFPQTDGG